MDSLSSLGRVRDYSVPKLGTQQHRMTSSVWSRSILGSKYSSHQYQQCANQWPAKISHTDDIFYPHASYESASDCTDSETRETILCRQAKMNERLRLPKPSVIDPSFGSRTSNIKPTSVSSAVNHRANPPSVCHALFTSVERDAAKGVTKAAPCDQFYAPLDLRLRKVRISPVVKSKRKMARVSKASNRRFEETIEKPQVDYSNFSQIAPWDTFSVASYAEQIYNTSTSKQTTVPLDDTKWTAKKYSKAKENDQKKKPSLMKPNRASWETFKSCSVKKSRLSLMETSLLVPIVEDFTRREISSYQRLRNIACCQALPAPTPTPDLRPKRTKQGTRSDASWPLYGGYAGLIIPCSPSPQHFDEAPGQKLITFIEAVRIVESMGWQRKGVATRVDSPSTTTSVPEEQKTSCTPITALNIPSCDTEASACCTVSTMPGDYNPVELLKKFKENMGLRRKVKAVPKSPTPQTNSRSRRTLLLKSIFLKLKRAKNQNLLPPFASCIDHEQELAFITKNKAIKRAFTRNSVKRTIKKCSYCRVGRSKKKQQSHKN